MKRRRVYLEKTNNYFVIHNYNTIPEDLILYCNNYIIYDASDKKTRDALKERKMNYIAVENTGHNITTYFKYIVDNYNELPETICFLKGNIIGRHCSREYFEKVFNNKFFTYLYDDIKSIGRLSKNLNNVMNRSAYLLNENQYIELNNSWYVNSPQHPHRFFDDLDRLLNFIYVNPVIPQYVMFSPGACYIVRREQILKNPPIFYRNLVSIMNYGLYPSFPSEAHQVERILPLIFESAYKLNDWMLNEEVFMKKLEEEKKLTELNDIKKSKKKSIKKSMICKIKDKCRGYYVDNKRN